MSGAKVSDEGHFPFGEQWYANSAATKWFFTSYERDAESGNDYAMAREYVNRLGRFSALDPAAPDSADPQSMNRYWYAGNDPINNVDPGGEDFMTNIIIAGTLDWLYNGSGLEGFDEFALLQMAAEPTAEVLNETDWYLDLSPAASGTNPINSETDLMYLGTAINSVSYIYGNSVALDFVGFSMNGGGGGTLSGPGIGMTEAKLMVLQQDCASFIMNVVLGAYNAIPGANSEDAFRGATDMPLTMVETLADTTYTASARPDPTDAVTGGTTFADTYAGSRAVTLYPAYYRQSPKAQGQTIIHEAVHDASGLTDQQLAQAATGNVFPPGAKGTAEASNAFNNELVKHCK